jgi:hypothetical protein
MIQFVAPSGKLIYINPAFVALVTEDDGLRAIIHVNLPALNGSYVAYTVAESVDSVVTRLEKASS